MNDERVNHNQSRDSVGIIGFGRFGRVLGKILSDDFKVVAYDTVNVEPQFGVDFIDLSTILKEKTIFLAVPIHLFKKLVIDIAPRLSESCTIIDVCSVKVYSVNVMQEILPSTVGIIGTHPLFGPDSIEHQNSLKIMMHNSRDTYSQFEFWSTYFSSKSIEVIHITPEKHDWIAARTQGITHFVGRVLRAAGIEQTEIDTVGFSDLLAVIDQTCNDSWELFMDLQNYNPYTSEMIEKLEKSITEIRGKILRRE
jgi:prephenate dehydrogenase